MSGYSISDQLQDIARHQSQVSERRGQWAESVRQTILESLQQIIIDNPGFDLRTEVNSTYQNLEAVMLCFEDRPSGIRTKSDLEVKQWLRQGATLGFSQMTDGKVMVWMSLPFVEEFEPKPQSIHLDRVNPIDLSVEKVRGIVNGFLSRLVSHNKSEDTPLGFVV